MDALVPDANQEHVIAQVVGGHTDGAALLAAQPGAGKTLVLVEIVKRLGLKRVLVVGRLNTRLGWKRTFERQGVTTPFYMLLDRKKDADLFAKLRDGEEGIFFIGQDSLVSTAFRGTKFPWAKVAKTLDMVAYDEIHGMQSRKSRRFAVVRTLKPRVLKVGMSGTWFGNRFEGAWSVTRWLWTHLIPASFWVWVYEWASESEEYLNVGGRRVKVRKVGDEKIPGAFAKSLPGYFYWERKLDIDVLPTKTLWVGMTPKQEKAYLQMEDDLIAWLDDNPLVAEAPIARFTRLRQFSLGLPTIDPDTDEVYFEDDCESPKIDAMLEYFEEEHDGGAAAIYTDSKIFARVVAYRLQDAYPDATVELWTGDTSLDERADIAERFERGEVNYLVATIASIGTGTDGLQHGARTLVWMNESTNSIDNEQGLFRFFRLGQKEDVVNVKIKTVGSMDDEDTSRLWETMRKRKDSMGTLMEMEVQK